jgi:Carboxypeptidase regulatory-like domain
MAISPCRALWGTRAVFAGTVTDIEELPVRDPAARIGSQRVIFSVAKGYRNVAASRIEIITHPDEASCGYEFKKGKQYLVYASSKDGFLTTGLCTRTRELAHAAEDIAYLTLLQGTPEAGRVSGRVIFAGQPLPREFQAGRMADVTVILRGAGVVREGRTDAQGYFEFRGVPPVSFSVAVIPSWPYAAEEEVEIEDPDPRQCTTDLQLQVRYDGRISGVLVDGSGRALSGIKVQAVGSEGVSGQEVRTTASGHYELTGLSPGSYVVGVNLTVPPSLESPYARLFAPGATERGKATFVELKAGERKAIAPLKMPAPIPEVSLTACVLGPDQRPTSEANVQVIWYGDSKSSYLMDHPDLDSQGCFSMRALSGLRYEVSAYATSLRDLRGYLFNTMQEITAGEHTSPVRLVLAPHRDR